MTKSNSIARRILLFVAAIATIFLSAYGGYSLGFNEGVKTPERFAAVYDWPKSIEDLRTSLQGMRAPESARAVLLGRIREEVWRLGSFSDSAVGECSPSDRETLRDAAGALHQDFHMREAQLRAGLDFCANLHSNKGRKAKPGGG